MKTLFVSCLILGVMSIHTGCTTHVWLTQHRIWPEIPAFTILPSTNAALYLEAGIDFDSVYVRNSLNNRGYLYYRFWPNGRVLLRSTVGRPTLEDVETFADASIGYYSTKASIVRSELYVPAGSPPWESGYELVESQIDKDSIVELNSRFNGSSAKDLLKYDLRYIKQPMPGMKRQPDW